MRQIRACCCIMFGMLLTLGIVTPARADSDDAYVHTLVQRAFEGKLTEQEKTYLISEHRDVAAQIPDLDNIKTESWSSRGDNENSGETEANLETWCKVFSGKATHKSLLGFTIYVFNHNVNVCGNYIQITKHDKPRYWLAEQDFFIELWNTVDEHVTGVGSATSTSRVQVRVRHCVVKYGCYANYYPTGTVEASANGTAQISTTPR